MYDQKFMAVVVCVLTLGVVVDISQGQTQCVINDLCSCTLSDGTGVIDISSLGNNDGTPLYTDIPGPDNYIYSLNLCYPFTEVTCTNAAVCQMEADMLSSYTLGDSSSATFEVDSLNEVHVKYTADTGDGNIRTTDVTLVCDPTMDSATIQVDGEQGPGSLIYAFTLTTKCACGNGCVSAPLPEPTTTTIMPKPYPVPKSSSDSGRGISTATIIYIIIIVLVLLKVLFWSFYCHIRGQRQRQAYTHRGICVDNSRDVLRNRPINREEDRISIIDQEYLPQGFNNSADRQVPVFPPSYHEVVNQSSDQFQKPPSYEQVVSNVSNQGSTHMSKLPDIPSSNATNNK